MSCPYNLILEITEAGGIVFNVGVEIVRATAANRIISRQDPAEEFEAQADEAIEWWTDQAAAALEEGRPPPHSCALDVADEGSHMLEEVGDIMHISRERVRQLESKALRELKHRTRRLRRQLGMEE